MVGLRLLAPGRMRRQVPESRAICALDAHFGPKSLPTAVTFVGELFMSLTLVHMWVWWRRRGWKRTARGEG